MEAAGESREQRVQGAGPPAGPPAPQRLPRARKKRTVYLEEQLQELKKHFKMNRYPSYQDRLALAARLDLDEQQVQVWFKNRRAKLARLQQLPKGQGWGDPTSVPVPFPVPALAPVPAGPAFPGIPGPSSVARHSPGQASPAATEPSVSSLRPAQRDPEWGSPERVPAAQTAVPVPDQARPQNSFASDSSPDPVLAPNFTAPLSPQDPLEEPSFPLMSGSQEGGLPRPLPAEDN